MGVGESMQLWLCSEFKVHFGFSLNVFTSFDSSRASRDAPLLVRADDGGP